MAAALLGTCESWERYTTLDERNSVRFCAALDSLVFACAGCGWWCDSDEQNDSVDHGWVCDECHEVAANTP